MPGTDAEFIAWAASKIGDPYQWGGTGPPHWTGYDCSGLVYADALTFGIMLPRTSQDMWAAAGVSQAGLRKVANTAQDPVRPADLAFFDVSSDGTYQPAHMGIYVGPNLMIEAPHTGEDVKYSTIPNQPGELLMGFARIELLTPGPWKPPPPAPGPVPTVPQGEKEMQITQLADGKIAFGGVNAQGHPLVWWGPPGGPYAVDDGTDIVHKTNPEIPEYTIQNS